MKKIINNPADCVPEMVDGLVRTYPQIIEQIPGTEAVVRSDKASMKGKVGIVSGGGSGHEPTHAGFVGKGMLSAAVCGQVFTSPTPDQIYEAIKASDNGAGTIFMHKILGYYAQNGASLDEIDKIAHVVLPNIKTIAVALSAATVPEVGRPGFELAEDEIEFGVGIHSEPGYRREKIQPSRALAAELLEKLDEKLLLNKDKKYAMLVNGMGATPLMEQYIFSHDVLDWLKEKEISPVFSKVGNFMTSLDMAGISLTLFELKDDEWLKALDAPAETIAWQKG